MDHNDYDGTPTPGSSAVRKPHYKRGEWRLYSSDDDEYNQTSLLPSPSRPDQRQEPRPVSDGAARAESRKTIYMFSRIKFEQMDDDDTRSTIHLYNRDIEDNAEEDRKPIVLSFAPTGCIEVSSDEESMASSMRVRDRRTTNRESNTSMRERLTRTVIVVKDAETQTDIAKKSDAATDVNEIETGAKTDVAVNTNIETNDVSISVDVDELLNNADLEEAMDVDESDNSATVESKKDKAIYFQCKTCSCYYLSFKLLQKHSLSQHNKAISADHKKVLYDMKCNFCSSVYVFATYNKHIKSKHTDRFNKSNNTKSKSNTGPYECIICAAKFLTYNEGKRHRRVHENIEQKSILRKISLSRDDTPSTSRSVKTDKPNRSPLHRKPIPKSILFQCPICELNFFSYRNGLRHRILCEKGGNKRGVIVNCAKCDKKFLSVHIRGHYQQHEMCTEFKIQPIVDGIEHTILYRCIKCKVCMEEKRCSMHFQSGCQSTGVPCTVCSHKIDKDHMLKHKEAHSHMGLTKAQIILVDVCD